MPVDTIWDVTLVSSVIFNKFVLNKMFLNEVSANLNTTYGDPLDVIGMTFIPLLYRWTVAIPPSNCCRVRRTRWYTWNRLSKYKQGVN